MCSPSNPDGCKLQGWEKEGKRNFPDFAHFTTVRQQSIRSPPCPSIRHPAHPFTTLPIHIKKLLGTIGKTFATLK
jgi:hypothetical protein